MKSLKILTVSITIMLLFSITTSSALARLLSTYSVDSRRMTELSDAIDKDTVIFISLEDTLYMSKAKMMRRNSQYRGFLNDLLAMGEKYDRYRLSLASWYGQRQLMLVEDEWPRYIELARQKGAKIYGIFSAKIQLTTEIEQRIAEQVRSLGVEFTGDMKGEETVEITKGEKWPTHFDKGIFFAGRIPRETLIYELFYEKALPLPAKLVVIDGSKRRLIRLDKKLRRFDMKPYNVVYLGASNKKVYPNPAIVKLQQDTLLKSNKWLEDDIAEQMLEGAKANQQEPKDK